MCFDENLMKYLFAHVGNLLENIVENLKMTQLNLWIIVKIIMNQLHMKNTGDQYTHLPGEITDSGVSLTGDLPSGSGALGEINGAFG